MSQHSRRPPLEPRVQCPRAGRRIVGRHESSEARMTVDQPMVLVVDGAVEQPTTFGFEDLELLPASSRIDDVSRFHAKRRGDGVALDALLERVRPLPEANYLTLHAAHDDFHVSVPLQAVRAEGVVVYKIGSERLDPSEGGPIRFLIRDPT